MKYFDSFAGIRGFAKGIEASMPEAECVGFSEIDKYAVQISNYHYPNHKNYGDITDINVRELPDFDLFVGGFPCQSFSIAGKGLGFEDARGTLFFEIARILEAKRPEWLLLENVKNLLSHDDYATIFRIYEILTQLGYSVGWEVVNSCHFGVPQNRERIFFVGHLRTAGGRAGEVFPVGEENKGIAKGAVKASIARTFTAGGHSGGMHSSMTLLQEKFTTNDHAYCLDSNYHKGVNSIEKSKRTHVVSGTWRAHKDGEGFREVESGLAPTIPARAREDGSGQAVIDNGAEIRRLTPKECERLQGFPDDWTAKGRIEEEEVEISDTQRYKTLGNAVTVPVITAITRKIGEVNVR